MTPARTLATIGALMGLAYLTILGSAWIVHRVEVAWGDGYAACVVMAMATAWFIAGAVLTFPRMGR